MKTLPRRSYTTQLHTLLPNFLNLTNCHASGCVEQEVNTGGLWFLTEIPPKTNCPYNMQHSMVDCRSPTPTANEPPANVPLPMNETFLAITRTHGFAGLVSNNNASSPLVQNGPPKQNPLRKSTTSTRRPPNQPSPKNMKLQNFFPLHNVMPLKAMIPFSSLSS
ncbi:hypothetical protein PDIG_12610 [Penicillium digitatum PHI26]|uniref:Uncharacterized protein n=2 Tax=Penicillium digitatum TaxID=36651 RepID=K9GTH8_PEND2|nr:hypothetical protein PDIP_38830 [Penicillium digitatum Pd1]EKV15808.1 hypothetical protein PDIP_38830 [Penicillium digitatum Pd1]EKV17873.1 hypothetical protein PDIG_12610 [Penicillium digitatum PHI26]